MRICPRSLSDQHRHQHIAPAPALTACVRLSAPLAAAPCASESRGGARRHAQRARVALLTEGEGTECVDPDWDSEGGGPVWSRAAYLKKQRSIRTASRLFSQLRLSSCLLAIVLANSCLRLKRGVSRLDSHSTVLVFLALLLFLRLLFRFEVLVRHHLGLLFI